MQIQFINVIIVKRFQMNFECKEWAKFKLAVK